MPLADCWPRVISLNWIAGLSVRQLKYPEKAFDVLVYKLNSQTEKPIRILLAAREIIDTAHEIKIFGEIHMSPGLQMGPFIFVVLKIKRTKRQSERPAVVIEANATARLDDPTADGKIVKLFGQLGRSEEHTSELQSHFHLLFR